MKPLKDLWETANELINIPLVNKAFTFASAAHGAVGQKRKYSGAPYIVHPVEVMVLVSGVEDHTKEMLAAALLHDVVEDTEIDQELIDGSFGTTVGALVDGLTDKSRPEDGNRAARKKIDLENLAKQPAAVQTIKCADLIANTKDIIYADENFAKVYMKEKRALLEALTKADRKIWSVAWKNVQDWEHSQVQQTLGRKEGK